MLGQPSIHGYSFVFVPMKALLVPTVAISLGFNWIMSQIDSVYCMYKLDQATVGHSHATIFNFRSPSN